MAELNVGTMNMKITADGAVAVAEIERVANAAESAQNRLNGIGSGSADFSGVASGAGEAATGLDKVASAAPSAASGLEQAGNAAKGTKSEMQTLGEQMTKVGKTMSTFATTGITAALTACVKGASDLTETLGKTEVTFGSLSDKVIAWADTSVSKMGLAKGSALEYASTFGDMATGMGLTQSAAADMATSLTQLAADLASFKNISTEVAAQKLNGVFTGETEALKSLGIVMTQTNLNAYAMSQGITQSVSSMSQAEQVALRYKYVLETTKNAQGDFERTGDSLANQSRKLTETIKQLGESFGTQLTPMVTPVVSKLQQLAENFSNLSDSEKNTIIAIAAVTAAIGPMLVVGGKVLTLITSLKVALAALTVGQIGVIVTALTLAVAGFVALKSALDGASDSSEEAESAYSRMKAALEGGVESKVNITLGEDGSEAKSAIDDLKSKTKNPITGEVDIQLSEDGSAAADAISDLNEMTAEPIVATVTADAKPSLDAAKQAVHDLQGTKYGTVEVQGKTVDIDGKIDEIQQDLKDLDTEVTLTANGDAIISSEGTGIIDQIQTKIGELEATIPLVADEKKRAKLEKQLGELQTALDTLSSGATITVSAEDLEKLTGGGTAEITVKVNGGDDLNNAKAAADALAALDGQTVRMTGEATELTTLISSIQTDIGNLSATVTLTASGDTLMTADQVDAIAAIQGKIDALKAKIPLELDEEKRKTMQDALDTLKQSVTDLQSGATITLTFTDATGDDTSKAEAFAEAVAKLPKDETYKATGEFYMSPDTEDTIKSYVDGITQAVTATSNYADSVSNLQNVIDKDYASKIAEVEQQGGAELIKIVQQHNDGVYETEEAYEAAFNQAVDDTQRAKKQLEEERDMYKEAVKVFDNGNREDDYGAGREMMERWVTGGVSAENRDASMKKMYNQQAQGGDMSEAQTEGATALAGALNGAKEQYQALTAAKAEYDASMAQAAQTESTAQAKYEQTTDNLTQMKEAMEQYYHMVSSEFSGAEAMESVDMSGWDATQVEAFTAAVTKADGSLIGMQEAEKALSDIKSDMTAAENEYTSAVESADSARQQAIDTMKSAVETAKSAGTFGENTTSADLEGMIDTITQTGTAVSEAQSTVITGVQGMLDSVSDAVSGENPMEAIEAAFSDTSSLETALEEVGKNGVQGMANGMEDTSAVEAASSDLGTAAVEPAAESAGCASPSTITEEVGRNVVQGLANGMGDTGAVESAGTALGSAAVSAAQSAASSGESAATSAGTAIGSALMSSAASGTDASTLTSAATSAVSTAASGAASSATTSGKSIGTNLIAGASAGVQAAASSLASAAAAAVTSAVNAAKSAAGIASPSKVMKAEVGVMLPRGAVEGIEEETDKLLPRVQNATRKLISGASSTVRGSTFTLPANSMPINYQAMGAAMKDAVSGVQFGFSVGDRELAQATRTANSREQAVRAKQISRGYGG